MNKVNLKVIVFCVFCDYLSICQFEYMLNFYVAINCHQSYQYCNTEDFSGESGLVLHINECPGAWFSQLSTIFPSLL